MRTTRTQRMLWKLFPNTINAVWRSAHKKGMELGEQRERREVSNRLTANHVKDFGKASLTLGYEHAAKAARGDLEDVA